MKSYSLVLIQFGAVALIALTGPWLAEGFLLQLLEGIGLGVGLWAIMTIRIGNFNITPDVKQNGQLVQSGPYQFIRHPMYFAVLLVTLALVCSQFSLLRLGIWIVLLVDLIVKMAFEEQLLAAHYTNYTHYQQQTYQLLPFIY
jgi:protein-S-isoprenylcysteine O-methyltransferase Ste14